MQKQNESNIEFSGALDRNSLPDKNEGWDLCYYC